MRISVVNGGARRGAPSIRGNYHKFVCAFVFVFFSFYSRVLVCVSY